jgi:D-glycero-D-manno-heptose 1,7-bisphosphate phosphatase
LRPAVFLDRDGTINREVHYLSKVEDFELLPGVGPALRRLAEAGYALVVITNQSGIARGYFTKADLDAIHGKMDALLAEYGVAVDAVYFSPAMPDDGDPTRKPGTGMIDRAVADLDLDLRRSWLVGDKTVDVKTGHNAGVRTILVRTGYGGDDGIHDATPDHVVADLAAAADVILG